MEIGISKEAYKDKPTTSINVTVEDVCQALPQDVLPNLNVAVNKRDSKTIHIVPKNSLEKKTGTKSAKQ